MQVGSIHVEVKNGFVVAARDDSGLSWRASAGRPLHRLVTHSLVLAAAFSPFVMTAASAHPGAGAGRAEGRVLVSLPIEVTERHEHRAMALLEAAAASPAGTPAAATATTPGAPPPPPPSPPRPFADAAPVSGSGGHFSFGWCTWYVSTKRYVPWMGNAIEWGVNAAAMGFPEGRTPRAGAIMVTRESGYGHVAYVEAVDADGNGFTVSEMNFRGFGVVSTRHIRLGQVPVVTFIY